MGILTESTKRIKESLLKEIEAESVTIAADLAARLPHDDGINAELEALKRQSRPEPPPEALAEAARLGTEVAPAIKAEIFKKLEKEVFPLVDKLISVHRQAAGLRYTTSNFYLSNFLDEIKTVFSGYGNSVSLGRRPIPSYTELKKKE